MAKNPILALLILAILCISSTTSSLNNLNSDSTQHVSARQDGVTETDFTQLTDDLTQFFERWSLQGGLQAAVYHDGRLVYSNSFGNATADQTGLEPMEDHHRMRIASLSKAITAAAIQTMVVNGDISLDDKMMTLLPEELKPSELEGCEYPNHSSNIDDNGTPDDSTDDVQFGISDITVAHLVNMRAGFPKAPPETGEAERPTTSWHYEHDWVDTDSNFQGKNNPCIDDVTVAQEYNDGFDAPVKIETTIRETLRLPLSWQPGTWYNYSNLGYRILGEIIEAQSGLAYDEYVKQYVLGPMGIDNMQLARTLIENKAEDEVTYYSRTNATFYSYFPLNDESDGGSADFGDSDAAPTPYGGSAPMEEMSASGGWIGNAISYGRFISYLDGTLHHPYFVDSFNYSKINPFGGIYANGIASISDNGQTWTHTGGLDGTSTSYERSLVNGDSVVIVLMSNTKPSKSENVTVRSINISYWDDMAETMESAFKIDYTSRAIQQEIESDYRPLIYEENSLCPPGTSEQGSGAHVIIFGPPPFKCYYDDQYGKKGPDFDDEKGWQECPEGTFTGGVGEPYYLLWNKDGGYIMCYLDKEMFDEELSDEDDCPEGEIKHENGRCVPETEDVSSLGMIATILCVCSAAFLARRKDSQTISNRNVSNETLRW